MRWKNGGTGRANSVLADVLAGNNAKKRPGNRVALNLSIEPAVKQAIADRAARANVSQADYLSTLILHGAQPAVTTSAQIAKPLVSVGYKLARALESNDLESTHALIKEARLLIVEALRPLQRSHQADVDANHLATDGWTG